MFKFLTQAYTQETWFNELIARASAWPAFQTLWSQTEDDMDHFFSTQPVFPIALNIPNIPRPMSFRITHVYFSPDPRFQVTHFVPFGAYTLRQCAVWPEEEGVR